MDKQFESQLIKEIESFVIWSKTAENSYGEWETDYLNWDRIYISTNNLIEKIPVGNWSTELVNKFLFILARDNECENIIDQLIDHPTQLIDLAKQSLSFNDFEARWQIAYGLGELTVNEEEVKLLLKRFILDEVEYVRRRASFAYEKKENK
ncbi:HEAT repeat domain-containing protein [Gottfriedia acidiceleris]|uniref:HEAT repeat domain-containing protein n=1 Tax=Gottfriedia acidiceleris TaxID=371036 RepID=UPI002FFFEA89